MNFENTLFHIHKSIIKSYVRSLLEFDLYMEEALPPGPKLLVANHPTTTDPFMLPLLVDKPVHIMITEMAFEIPVFGHLLRKAGHIRVNKRFPNGSEIIPQAIERLQRGETVAIFPEGRLSPANGTPATPRTGAVRIALQANVPIIPIGIHLSPDALARQQVKTTHFDSQARWAVRGSYYMTAGRALHLQGDVNDHQLVRNLSERVMDNILLQAEKSSRRMQAGHISWTPLLRNFIRRFLTQS